MKLHPTLERLRSFGGLGTVELDPSDDGWEVVDDYHGYAGTEPAAGDDADDADDAGTGGGLRLLARRRTRHAPDRAGDDSAGDDSAGDDLAVAAAVGIDPRIAARRRDVVLERDVKRQKRWLTVAVVTTVVALAFGVTRSGLLDLDEIRVRDGAHTSADQLRAASGLRPGEPLLGLDVDGAVARMKGLPWVADAQAVKHWDGSVDVTFTERTPAAAVSVGDGAVLLVDADRRVLARVPAVSTDLVTISGVAAADPAATLDPAIQPAVDLARALPPGVRTRVTDVRVLPTGQFELGLRPAGRAVLGRGADLDRKVLSLTTVLGQVDLHQLCVLDLRVPDRPVLTRDGTCA